MTDTLRTLIFETASARAQMVRLTNTWQTIAASNNYPPAVKSLLGQLVAASAVLSASLKFEGSLILQIQGDGPIRLIVAECNSRLGLRATVKMVEGAEIADNATFQEMVNLNGKGMCVIVLDPRNRLPGQVPYQGIVPLIGQGISDALEAYMHSSEQLETRLVLNSDEQCAAGLMLQQMPTSGGKSTEHVFDPDGWNRLLALANTLGTDEHLNTGIDELGTRLFWEEQAAKLADRNPHFECSCSRDKVRKMLFNLGASEIEDALKDKPIIEVICDFCGTAYTFDRPQCEALLLMTDAEQSTDGNGRTLH